ncbi:MAG: 2'-5' RNA ligase family protein [Pseudomonadota bacterium]
MNGLAVLFPTLDRHTDPIRRRHDPSAAQGLGAHVTVLFPFHPPDMDGVAEVFETTQPFDVQFVRFGRFPEILYLAPEPDAPFVALTRAVWAAFPDCPPYEDAFGTIVPHLTLGHGADLAQPELPLPLTARAETVSHMTLTADGWIEARRYPLGPTPKEQP